MALVIPVCSSFPPGACLSSSAAPRRRGRPSKKRNDKEPGARSPKPNEQQQQIQKPELAMILYGANLPPEYLEAVKAANEAAQRNASIKEIPWSGVELDALWVGVRRHGPDNWDTILEDPNLYILVLCRKTSPALSWRWQIELEKMHSILKTSGFLLPSTAPTTLTHHETREHRQAAISNEGGEGTPQHVLPPPSQIPVTSTQCRPLAPNLHQGSSSPSSFPAAAVIASNGGEVGGEPVNQTPNPKAISDGEPIAEQVLLPPKISVTSTEFGLLIQNHQGSPSSCSVPAAAVTVLNGGEAGGESVDQTPETAAILSDGEATSQQVLPQLRVPVTSRESAPLVQNHQGSSSSCSVPVAAVIVPNEGEAGGEPVNQTPEPPAISSDGEATAQQVLPQLQISVASTESASLVPNHHQATSSLVLAAAITIPNIGQAGGEPVNQTPEPPAKSDEATTQQVQVASTESGLLVRNFQGSSSSTSILAAVVTVSNGEEAAEPIEANTQQLLIPEIPVDSPEFGASGPNHHPGASSSLRDSPLLPVAEVVSNGEAVGGERIEASSTDQKHLSVTTYPPESGGALVVVGRNNDQRGSSSSMIQRDYDVTVAIPPSSPSPQWRPNLNLHPMANHMLFEAFQQREANLEAQMMRNHMVGVVEEAAPGRSVSMVAQSPPANNSTTVRPDNLFLGGFFPVRNQN